MKISNFKKRFFLSLSKGFTMIELLIVIAVLGILAVAVLSAINPIEQINRSKDTGNRSDAEQLIGGIDRFYTANGYYPWQPSPTDPNTGKVTVWGKVDKTTWKETSSPSTALVLPKLSAAGTAELKESFITRISATTYNFLYKYNKGGLGDSTYICFFPKSANFLNEAGLRCGTTLPSDFPTVNACPGAVGACATAKTCYSCLP